MRPKTALLKIVQKTNHKSDQPAVLQAAGFYLRGLVFNVASLNPIQLHNKITRHLFLVLFSSLFVCSNSFAQPEPENNQLIGNSSTYLAMHGHDPVHWQLWNANILKQAQQQNKLIFISSGYFACHWCHVMQHENYQNSATAKLINQHFIAVKIDSELNPELDKALIEFSQKTTGQAGWPQHVILTPDGYPFSAFIYLPNKGFTDLLNKIITLWQTQPTMIEQLAKKEAQTTQQQSSALNNTQNELLLANEFTEKFARQLIKQTNRKQDDLSGGLQGSNKFPEAPLLNSLLSIKKLPSETKDWLILTLEQMQSQHLMDHINGGFYRYTVDPEWQIQHFEKMTYTNALLANTYLLAGQRFNRTDFLQTAKTTLHYLRTQLYSPTTQLYQSSQSALDLQGNEGGSYLFNQQQLKQILSPTEFQSIYQAWSLDHTTPYELGWHPLPIKTKASWKSIQQKLQNASKDIPTDSKSILGWNGLVLSALSQAYGVLKEDKYKQQANQLADTLAKLISKSSPPRAVSNKGEFMGQANLQDYAFIKQGLQNYQAWVNPQQYSKTVQFIDHTINHKFYSKNGWHYDATPILPQQTGEWVMPDNAIPSPTAIISCLQPQFSQNAKPLLLAQTLNYASYLNHLNCVNQPINPVK